MDYILSHKIATTSSQKAAALRDQLAALLDEDDNVTVINSSMAQVTQTYDVIGVDTSSKKPFRESIEAKDEEDAEARVVGKSQSKVVSEVRPT